MESRETDIQATFRWEKKLWTGAKILKSIGGPVSDFFDDALGTSQKDSNRTKISAEELDKKQLHAPNRASSMESH